MNDNWINDFIHNAIVHPMLPFLPVKLGDRIHDWHAAKVFGLQRFDELKLEKRQEQDNDFKRGEGDE